MPSGAEFAKRGVAHVVPLPHCARPALAPAAAPRSPQHSVRIVLVERSLDRPSSIVSPDPGFVKGTKIGDVGQQPRRRPAGASGSVCSRRCAPRRSRAREGSNNSERGHYKQIILSAQSGFCIDQHQQTACRRKTRRWPRYLPTATMWQLSSATGWACVAEKHYCDVIV